MLVLIWHFRFWKVIDICYFFDPSYSPLWASLVAQSVKKLPAEQETLVQSLGWEDPLEKEMTAHSSTLAWKITWKEEPARLQSRESQRVWHDGATSLSLLLIIFDLPSNESHYMILCVGKKCIYLAIILKFQSKI